MERDNKNWASAYILDPLSGSNPSDETGPGSSFRQRDPDTKADSSRKSSGKVGSPAVSVTEQSTSSSTNPFRRGPSSPSKPNPHVLHRELSGLGDLPVRALISSREPSGHRNEAQKGLNGGRIRSSSAGNHDVPPNPAGRPRRASSLSQRYPGDRSHRPLDTIEREHKLAQRSPHLRKQHLPHTDSIDALDRSLLGSYHHEGPYDATLFSRNTSYKSSPVAAVSGTNQKAIRATPQDKVRDSLHDHRPLDGTSYYPPGMRDPSGNVLYYEEGENMMTSHGGDYKRWPGLQYHPDDIKGKGEPSYTIEKNLKDHGAAVSGAPPNEYELVERPRHSPRGSGIQRSADGEAMSTGGQRYSDWERNHNKGHGRSISGELKRRVGSLRKKDKQAVDT